jgi:hypothetical protein
MRWSRTRWTSGIVIILVSSAGARGESRLARGKTKGSDVVAASAGSGLGVSGHAVITEAPA